MPTLGAPITLQDWSALMTQQIQLLNPHVSAQVGTPERDLIDTVAKALSSAQTDVGSLQNSNSVDSKIGSNLAIYTGLFGFSQQQGTYATGTVTFSTSGAATQAIAIPFNTQVLAQPTTTTQIAFDTTQNAIIAVGETSVDVPVQAEVPGTSGNVDAGTITALGGANLIAGITSVTNAAATSNGANQETDSAYKVRFKNQVFRNVSGTTDQYLATGLSGLYSTKANVIGPISRYREYIQIPTVNDSLPEYVNNGQGFSIPVSGNGSSGQYSTALSSNPYAKYIWANIPSFVSNGTLDSTAIFYQPGLDWVLNTTPFAKNRGDAYRFWYAVNQPKVSPPDPNTVTDGGALPGGTLGTGTYNYVVTAYLTTSSGGYGETDYVASIPITISVANHVPVIQFALEDHALGYNIYRENSSNQWAWAGSVTAYTIENYVNGYPGFQDLGTNAAGTVNPNTGVANPPTTNTAVLPFNDVYDPNNSPYRPSVTFINVYTGTDTTVQAATPGEVCLFEWSYTSSESRNDYIRNVTNAVDLFVDGQNPTTATTSLALPEAGVNVVNTTSSNAITYINNYRRIGEREQRPAGSSILQSLYYTPLVSLPSTIQTSYATYYEGLHYWAIQETDSIGHTIQARDGIEWNPGLPGQALNLTSNTGDPSPDSNNALPWTTLATAISNGATVTNIYCNPLSGSLPDGATINLAVDNSTVTQNFITSSAVASDAETIPVISQVASSAFSIGTHINSQFTGPTIVQDYSYSSSYTVTGYQYDKNIVDLQSSVEGIKQATTDALVHSADTIYLKLDFTVAYTAGSNPGTVNAAIQTALSSYLSGQYFGSLITLSSLLGIVYNTNGVANVRWTYEIDDTKPQVQYVDINGNPLTQLYFQRVNSGSTTVNEQQSFYIVGTPIEGSFSINFNDQTSPLYGWQGNSQAISSVLAALSSFGYTATCSNTTAAGTYLAPYVIQFSSRGQQASVISCNSYLIGNQYTQTNDFYLKDNQLPALPTGQLSTDTLPGLIVRQRSQDAWSF